MALLEKWQDESQEKRSGSEASSYRVMLLPAPRDCGVADLFLPGKPEKSN
jgi:hypothetical protein